MSINRRIVVGAIAMLATTASRGEAQVTFSAACSPGIPSCASARFFIEAIGGITVNQLVIELLHPSWHFVGGATPTVGSYSAFDSYGVFSGFTTIGADGRTLAIDFTENGFAFELFSSENGFLDVEAQGGDVKDLWFTVTGETADGQVFEATATPEPATMSLVATGLAALGLRRRRKRSAAARAG